MDATKDIVDADTHQNEEGDVNAIAIEQSDVNNTSTNNTINNTSTDEGMAEVIYPNTAEPHTSNTDLETSKVTVDLENNLASINEQNNPPVPFNSAEFEHDEDRIAKKKAKDEMMNQRPTAAVSTNEVVVVSSNRDSIHEPPRVARDIESQTRTDNTDTAGSINYSLVDTEATVEPTSTNQVVGDTEIHIPEAFLVEDNEDEVVVYDATNFG